MTPENTRDDTSQHMHGTNGSRTYWNGTAREYRIRTRVSCGDFHYGPLLPGDSELQALPSNVEGLSALELGCGGAQNSIFLARHGAARTVAVDFSTAQIAWATQLAREYRVELEIVVADLEHLPFRNTSRFDLVHSTYALPFLPVRAQQQLIRTAADLVRPGGTFLLATAHPLSCAEWLEVDDGETGVFCDSYVAPPADRRDGACCQPVPLGLLFDWLTDAGLRVTRMLEPAPLPVHEMTENEINDRVPYDSDRWRALYDRLNRFPPVAIFVASRDLAPTETPDFVRVSSQPLSGVPNQCRITRAEPNDFLAIAELDRQAWKQNRFPDRIPDGEHVWRIWTEQALVFCARATESNIILGAVVAFPCLDGSFCLHKVFVCPDSRGRGIGAQLCESILEELDRRRTTVFLTVDPANRRALRLYRRWGFLPRAFVPGYYRPEEDRHVLVRSARHVPPQGNGVSHANCDRND